MLRRIASFGLSCLHLSLWNLHLRLRGYHLFINAILYLFTLAFICYLILKNANFTVKTALFWLILFLIILYFIQQSLAEERHPIAFYYFLISPAVFLLASIIQNTLIGFGLAWLNYLVFYGLFDYKIPHFGAFFLLISLATIGFSALFSFLGTLARYSSQSSGILSILSLPLIIPQLSLILKIATQISSENTPIPWRSLLSLFSLDLLILCLALILFRYLWKL